MRTAVHVRTAHTGPHNAAALTCWGARAQMPADAPIASLHFLCIASVAGMLGPLRVACKRANCILERTHKRRGPSRSRRSDHRMAADLGPATAGFAQLQVLSSLVTALLADRTRRGDPDRPNACTARFRRRPSARGTWRPASSCSAGSRWGQQRGRARHLPTGGHWAPPATPHRSRPQQPALSRTA